MRIPNNISALFERSEEHVRELEEEYQISIENGIVSPRAKIITHQALSLCRHALDHGMRVYWNTKWFDRLPEGEKKRLYLIYFPITWDKKGFQGRLKKNNMANLKTHDPHVYDFLFNCQAFNDKNYRWLQTLNRLAGKGKHEQLIAQRRIEYTHYTLEYAPEGNIVWRVSTTKLDPNNIAKKRSQYIGSEKLPENRGFKETVTKRPAIAIVSPDDSEFNALFFCQEVREKTLELLGEFFQLF